MKKTQKCTDSTYKKLTDAKSTIIYLLRSTIKIPCLVSSLGIFVIFYESSYSFPLFQQELSFLTEISHVFWQFILYSKIFARPCLFSSRKINKNKEVLFFTLTFLLHDNFIDAHLENPHNTLHFFYKQLVSYK